MNARKHGWISGLITNTFAVVLWESALRLLGLKQMFPPGVAGFVGSVIVFAGSISLANQVGSLWKRDGAGRRDLYTEVQAQIEAEKRIKNDAEPVGCTKPRDNVTAGNATPPARDW